MKITTSAKWLSVGLSALVMPAIAHSQAWPDSTPWRGLRPLFVENQGQFPDAVRYRSAVPGAMASLTDEGLVLTVAEGQSRDAEEVPLAHNVLLRFGSTTPPRGEGIAEGHSSYFLGNDRSRWISGARCWTSVVFDAAAPGVSVEIHGRNGLLEYDVLAIPGAAVENMTITVDGANALRPQPDGSLEVVTSAGTIRQLPPQAWQVEPDGDRRAVTIRVAMRGPSAFGFDVLGRDVTRPLVIDPGLVYGTFVETNGPDVGRSIAADSAGCAYVFGEVFTNDFPTTPGVVQPTQQGTWVDTVVAKISADGSHLVYSTYLGGSSDESAWRIVVTGGGDAIIAGDTLSSDFPTTDGAYSQRCGGNDGFLTRLNADGTALVFSTYFGGSSNAATTLVDAAIDSAGRIVVGGGVVAADLPITPDAAQQTLPEPPGGFIVRFLPDGSDIDYCTYVGCMALMRVAVDDSMAIYATGYTTSSKGLPVTPGAFQTNYGGGGLADAFALKLEPDGALAWCTLLGGNADDRAWGLGLSSLGEPVIAGWTSSTSGTFPTTPNSYHPLANGGQDGFITKLSADGSSLVWSTRFGGGGNDSIDGLAVDAIGNSYVVGGTNSANLPTTPDAFDRSMGGPADAYVAKLSADGTTLKYGTYLGSSVPAVEPHNAIAIDPQGNAYIIGYSSGADIPTTPGAYDTELSGFSGIYVAKFDLSTWHDVGCGLPDFWSGVTPRLTANGSLLPMSAGSLHVDQVFPNGACVLILGLNELALPFKGGTMVPHPLWLMPFVLNGQGKFDLTWTAWPQAVPAGTPLWFQVWIKDAGAETGFEATNGLHATVPAH